MSTETGATIAEQAAQVKAASATQLPAEVGAAFASEQAALDAAGVPAGTVALGDEMAQFGFVRTRPAGAGHCPAYPAADRAGRDRLLPWRLVPVLQRRAADLPA